MNHPGFTSLKKAMEMTLDRLGLGGSLATVAIRRVWPQVVGEEVARRSRPDRIRNGRLQVIVGDAVWLQQLVMLKPQIMARLKAHAPAVRDIFFTVGISTSPSSPAEGTYRPKSDPLSPETEVRIQEAVQPVHDEECREVLTRILRKAWRRE
ncbi:MAG: DciA family protein [Candidatus Methylomirabilales bacterium]